MLCAGCGATLIAGDEKKRVMTGIGPFCALHCGGFCSLLLIQLDCTSSSDCSGTDLLCNPQIFSL